MQAAPQNANPLDQLKDIQLPQESLWWPPSWVLIITIIIAVSLIIAAIYFAIYYWRKQAAKRLALKQLEELSQNTAGDKALLDEVAELLRRYSISKNPTTAKLSMQSWQQQLAKHMDKSQAELLAISRYQQSVEVNRSELINAARSYIKKLNTQTSHSEANDD